MAKEKNTDQEAEQESAKSGKKLSLKLLVLIFAILLLGIGAYFGYTYFYPGSENATNATKKDQPDKTKQNTSMVSLPTILVNLADPLGKRYLKMTAKLEVQGDKAKTMVKDNMPKIKDSVIMLLSSKSFKDLSSMDKKIRLKKQIVKRINQILQEPVINQVFFTEFVIQ